MTHQVNTYSMNTIQYIVYYSPHPIELSHTNDKLHLLSSDEDLSFLFVLQDARLDPFRTRISNISTILAEYDNIHTPNILEKFSQRGHAEGMIGRLNQSLRTTHYQDLPEHIETDARYVSGIQKLRDIVNASLPNLSNHVLTDDFLRSYTFPKDSKLSSGIIYRTITLKDVYYKNKQWYTADKQPIHIQEFYDDVEYRQFTKGVVDDSIHTGPVQSISEDVLFLDYVYGWYNFGEFWDVLRRAIACEKKHLPLFHCSRNRVLDFPFYFDTIGCERKYVCEPNILYHFDTIHISILKGACRGYYNRFEAFHLNQIYNPSPPIDDGYVLYLSRGANRRTVLKEDELIESMRLIHPCIVLDGTESREQIFHSFTNAKCIVGVHGSLMKNTIWCKRSPIFIELVPHTRKLCFVGNAENMGFRCLCFIVECDANEQISLKDTQKHALLNIFEACVR